MNFGACTDGFDTIMTDNNLNEDGNHPVHFTTTTLQNVDLKAKMFFNTPSVG